MQLTRVDDAELELTVPTGFLRDWIARNYLPKLQDAVRSTIGGERKICILVGAAAAATTDASSARISSRHAGNGSKRRA